MCGFAGFYTHENISHETRRSYLDSMSSAIAHRGPDGSGFWIDPHSGMSLSHRRLAVVDLSPHGAQPMTSHSGRYVIIFNGEIYNYKLLKTEIDEFIKIKENYWDGSSDTEVILAGFDHWGIESTVQKLNGMFAFAVWDLETQSLYLVRDRIGEKPLYYGWNCNNFLFGSELKLFKNHPKFNKTINMQAVESFLKYNYIPCPQSIYEGIFKLTPGTILCLSRADLQKQNLPTPKSYWSLSDIALKGFQSPTILSENEAIQHLDNLLNCAVEQQMVADVPVGAFLSGGIDSSTIVALMQNYAKVPVKTFTIGFEQADLNEAIYAKSIAKHLKTDHTELYISDQEALDVISSLPHLYDEPFADSSQIPTHLVSMLARRQVTVSLSGDGGDELFGGYNRHILASRLESITNKVPYSIRRLFGNAIHTIPPRFLNKLSESASTIFQQKHLPSHLGDKVRKFSDALSRNKEDIYQSLVSNFQYPQQFLLHPGNKNFLQKEENKIIQKHFIDFAHQMMLSDSLTYLPDDILVKVDRAAMSVSLETRVPMLDKNVVEFAWQLPLSMKIKSGQGKWILRQVLGKYIPFSLFERPKQGFAIPLDAWLRGPLKSWAESLLSESTIQAVGILNPQPVQKIWKEHLSGERNWQQQIWAFLMLQAWLLENK